MPQNGRTTEWLRQRRGETSAPEPVETRRPVDDLVTFAEDRGARVTSTTGGRHNVGSRHPLGQAVDIGTRDLTPEQQASIKADAVARGIRVVDETTRPAGQQVWSGPHLHMERERPISRATEWIAKRRAGQSTATKLPDYTNPLKVMGDKQPALNDFKYKQPPVRQTQQLRKPLRLNPNAPLMEGLPDGTAENEPAYSRLITEAQQNQSPERRLERRRAAFEGKTAPQQVRELVRQGLDQGTTAAADTARSLLQAGKELTGWDTGKSDYSNVGRTIEAGARRLSKGFLITPEAQQQEEIAKRLVAERDFRRRAADPEWSAENQIRKAQQAEDVAATESNDPRVNLARNVARGVPSALMQMGPTVVGGMAAGPVGAVAATLPQQDFADPVTAAADMAGTYLGMKAGGAANRVLAPASAPVRYGGAMVAGGATNAAQSAGSQLARTGKIDPQQVIEEGVTGAVLGVRDAYEGRKYARAVRAQNAADRQLSQNVRGYVDAERAALRDTVAGQESILNGAPKPDAPKAPTNQASGLPQGMRPFNGEKTAPDERIVNIGSGRENSKKFVYDSKLYPTKEDAKKAYQDSLKPAKAPKSDSAEKDFNRFSQAADTFLTAEQARQDAEYFGEYDRAERLSKEAREAAKSLPKGLIDPSQQNTRMERLKANSGRYSRLAEAQRLNESGDVQYEELNQREAAQAAELEAQKKAVTAERATLERRLAEERASENAAATAKPAPQPAQPKPATINQKGIREAEALNRKLADEQQARLDNETALQDAQEARARYEEAGDAAGVRSADLEIKKLLLARQKSTGNVATRIEIGRRVADIDASLRGNRGQSAPRRVTKDAESPLLGSVINPDGGVPSARLPESQPQSVRFEDLADKSRGAQTNNIRLLAKIRQLGGINPDIHSGELVDAIEKGYPGLINRRSGIKPDQLLQQLAIDEGYPLDPSDLNTLWRAINEDAAGKAVFPMDKSRSRELADEEAAYWEDRAMSEALRNEENQPTATIGLTPSPAEAVRSGSLRESQAASDVQAPPSSGERISAQLRNLDAEFEAGNQQNARDLDAQRQAVEDRRKAYEQMRQQPAPESPQPKPEPTPFDGIKLTKSPGGRGFKLRLPYANPDFLRAAKPLMGNFRKDINGRGGEWFVDPKNTDRIKELVAYHYKQNVAVEGDTANFEPVPLDALTPAERSQYAQMVEDNADAVSRLEAMQNVESDEGKAIQSQLREYLAANGFGMRHFDALMTTIKGEHAKRAKEADDIERYRAAQQPKEAPKPAPVPEKPRLTKVGNSEPLYRTPTSELRPPSRMLSETQLPVNARLREFEAMSTPELRAEIERLQAVRNRDIVEGHLSSDEQSALMRDMQQARELYKQRPDKLPLTEPREAVTPEKRASRVARNEAAAEEQRRGDALMSEPVSYRDITGTLPSGFLRATEGSGYTGDLQRAQREGTGPLQQTARRATNELNRSTQLSENREALAAGDAGTRGLGNRPAEPARSSERGNTPQGIQAGGRDQRAASPRTNRQTAGEQRAHVSNEPQPVNDTTGRQLQHSKKGILDELKNQQNVPKGKVRVRDQEGNISVVQRPSGHLGNQDAAWLKTGRLTMKKAEPANDLNAQNLLPAMQRVEPQSRGGALVSLTNLRTQFPQLSKEDFDNAILDQARKGNLVLHRHDYPASLSPEERAGLVFEPHSYGTSLDGKTGNYYIGVTAEDGLLSQGKVKAEPAKDTPAPKSNLTPEAESVRRALEQEGGQMKRVNAVRLTGLPNSKLKPALDELTKAGLVSESNGELQLADKGTNVNRYAVVSDFTIGGQAEIVHFYADVAVGRRGKVIKTWTTPQGQDWVKLDFGKNQGGQKLQKSFPTNVLQPVKSDDAASQPNTPRGLRGRNKEAGFIGNKGGKGRAKLPDFNYGEFLSSLDKRGKVKEMTEAEYDTLIDLVDDLAMHHANGDAKAFAETKKKITGLTRDDWQTVVGTMRKAGLLTSVRTHLRNVGGNAGFQLLEETSRIPGSIVDAAIGLATKERTFTRAHLSDFGRAGYKGATEGISKAWQVLKSGAPDAQQQAQQYAEQYTGDGWLFDRKLKDIYTNTVFRLLSAEDQIFRTFALSRALAGRADAMARTEAKQGKIKNDRASIQARKKELFDNPSDDLLAEATLDAEVATFNNDNPVSKGVAKLREEVKGKSKTANLGIDLIMPFDRTPTNIIARALEYSPLGFGKNAVQIANAISKKTFTPQQQRNFSQTFGRAFVGTGLITLGYTLASQGMMTGYRDDDEQKDFALMAKERREGRSAGAIYNPATNTWHQVMGFSPIGNMLAIGASFFEQGGGAQAAVYAGAKTVAAQPLLESGDTLLDFKNDAARAAGRMTASFVPSLVKDMGALKDNKARKAGGFVEQVQRAVPVWRESLPEQPEYETRLTDAIDPTMTRTNRAPIVPRLLVKTEEEQKAADEKKARKQQKAKPATLRPEVPYGVTPTPTPRPRATQRLMNR